MSFLALVTPIGCNFAPAGWALCHGQLLSIASNTALFSLLGTYYGGDGKVTFALPDLRGRAIVGDGQGPGLSPYDIGQQGGAETTTLSSLEIPSHVHTLTVSATLGCSSSNGNTPNPNNAVYAPLSSGSNAFSSSGSQKMKPYNVSVNTAPAGTGLPFNNRNPYLALTYIICMQGTFPQRP